MSSPSLRLALLTCLGLLGPLSGCVDKGDKRPTDDEPPVSGEPASSADTTDTGASDTGEGPGTDTGDPSDTAETGGGSDTGDSGEADECDETLDTDCDGLLDTLEIMLGSDLHSDTSDLDNLDDYTDFMVNLLDPTNHDTDGDGLYDDEELVSHHTHPRCRDTDADGIIDSEDSEPGLASDGLAVDCVDWWEEVVGLPDPNGDDDTDTLTNLEEWDCGTSTSSPDTDGDGLGDAIECARSDVDATDWDSDDDTISDGDEVNVYGTHPDNDDSDGDGLNDFEELFTYHTDPNDEDTDGDGLHDDVELGLGTDPTLAHSDADLLNDGDEVAEGCDPLDDDTDEDGLNDDEEVNTHGTDCTNDDTDSGGMPDGLEVAGGLDPLTLDDGTSDYAYVEVNEVWPCESVSARTVTYNTSTGASDLTFDLDAQHYGNLDYDTGAYKQVECVCDDVRIAALDPVAINGITVWTEQAVHTTDIGSSYRAWQGLWSDYPTAQAVGVTPGWTTLQVSEYDDTHLVAGGLEVGLDSEGEAAWMAFDSTPSTLDGTHSVTTVDVNGPLDVRVSYANTDKDGLGDCGELTYVSSATTSKGDDHGLQVRVDPVSAAARRPPAALPASDALACVQGMVGQTRLGFVHSPVSGRAPIPLSGTLAYGHSAFTKVKVHDWRGAEWVTLTHTDGQTLTLSPMADTVVLPMSDGWTLGTTQWRMGRDSAGRFSEPVVEIDHRCSGLDTIDVGPVEVAGYALSFDQIDSMLSALGTPWSAATTWPALRGSDRTPFRARVIPPDTWVDGPTQARLRIDIAGGPTVLELPIDPVLASPLRSVTPPDMVHAWTIRRTARHHTIDAELQQTATGLSVTLTTLSLGDGDLFSLSAPLSLTLPAE